MERSKVSHELKRLNAYFRACNLLTGNDYFILNSAADMLKTAKWMYDEEYNVFYCSNCHACINKNERARNFFCYHCGAEMKY